MMYTYQDLLAVGDDEHERMRFVQDAVRAHKQTRPYAIARDAEAYDRRLNVTINRYTQVIYDLAGNAYDDPTRANHRLASGFFQRFINQETQYLLGDGVILSDPANKDKLGKDFDAKLMDVGHDALVGGVAFGFWNHDHLDVFRLTEFVPLYDEESGALCAGIRFWRVHELKPRRYTLYELDGYTDYVRPRNGDMAVMHDKRPYRVTVATSQVDGTTIYAGENYPTFPIVPCWGNNYKQSELIGLREHIDCYDLIKSGFANDLDEATLLYWIIEGAGGMDDADLARFLDRIHVVHAASVADDQKVTSHTQDVPFAAREAYLSRLEADMYKDYQALDVSVISGGQRTATEIRAAYTPLDKKCDLFEHCIKTFLRDVFALAGIDDEPTFTRHQISNDNEMTQQVVLAAPLIGDSMAIRKLPFLSPEEVNELLEEREADEFAAFHATNETD